MVMEHETHLGPICWEVQMKVSLQDVSFSQTPKACMVRRPEGTLLLLGVRMAQLGFGSISKHYVQKILLYKTVYTLPGK